MIQKLFYLLRYNQKVKLNEDLKKIIKFEIRSNLSPKHVPSKIFQVKDIPKTKSGKIVELSIKNIINGYNVKNTNALANPDCLKEYENIYQKLKKINLCQIQIVISTLGGPEVLKYQEYSLPKNIKNNGKN